MLLSQFSKYRVNLNTEIINTTVFTLNRVNIKFSVGYCSPNVPYHIWHYSDFQADPNGAGAGRDLCYPDEPADDHIIVVEVRGDNQVFLRLLRSVAR